MKGIGDMDLDGACKHKGQCAEFGSLEVGAFGMSGDMHTARARGYALLPSISSVLLLSCPQCLKLLLPSAVLAQFSTLDPMSAPYCHPVMSSLCQTGSLSQSTCAVSIISRRLPPPIRSTVELLLISLLDPLGLLPSCSSDRWSVASMLTSCSSTAPTMRIQCQGPMSSTPSCEPVSSVSIPRSSPSPLLRSALSLTWFSPRPQPSRTTSRLTLLFMSSLVLSTSSRHYDPHPLALPTMKSQLLELVGVH